MVHFFEYAGIYAIGAAGYTLIELIWRGFSHWTMALTGGLCFLILYLLEQTVLPRHVKAALGTLAITLLELGVGFVVNLRLGWAVWDYSSMPHNFMGQICLLYSILWYLLCIPAGLLCARLHRLAKRRFEPTVEPTMLKE